jgi:hypothetical protein
MSSQPNAIDDIEQTSVEQIVVEVAAILSRRISQKDIVKLLGMIFLETNEVAELLRVKPKTVSTWVSKGLIPVRYAGGRPIFLLAEVIAWTLPEDDRHSQHRLSTAAGCNIAANRLAAMRERES